MKKTEFICKECGEKQEMAVPKTKHGLKGAASLIERNADCCDKPSYRHRRSSSRGLHA